MSLVALAMHCVPGFMTNREPYYWKNKFRITNQEVVPEIPKIIHQTYKTKSLPKEWRSIPAEYKKKFPTWEYKFWTDVENRKFLEDHYSWFLHIYDSYPYNIQRADAIRYFLLYHYGGIYVDMDVAPSVDLKPLLEGYETVLPETPDFGLTNAFMASTKHSEFMSYTISQLPIMKDQVHHWTRHFTILTSTGPTFLTYCFETYDRKDSVVIVPSKVWGKCGLCESCTETSNQWFKHRNGSSWHSFESRLIIIVIWCYLHWTILVISVFFFWLFFRYKVHTKLQWYFNPQSVQHTRDLINVEETEPMIDPNLTESKLGDIN